MKRIFVFCLTFVFLLSGCSQLEPLQEKIETEETEESVENIKIDTSLTFEEDAKIDLFGGEVMRFRLIVDQDKEEEIVATVHAPSSLTQEIETLVCRFSGADAIMGYSDDEIRKLDFTDIECITVLDRKVIAVDTQGNRYVLKDRLRDLEEILPSYFIRIN
mgnify:CR=1 FL=1